MDEAVLDLYRRVGYVHLRGLFDADVVRTLTDAIEAAGEDPAPNPLSLDTMRFASNLYRRSLPVREFLVCNEVVDLVTSVLGPDVWCRWDQAVWKGPGAPEFPWHQDNGYTGLSVPHLQLWVALTSMRLDNGGLLVAPGKHTRSLEHRWSGNHVALPQPTQVEVVDASAGDVVVFSSLLPHATAPNRTSTTRLAYVAEFLPSSEDDPSVPTPRLTVAERGVPSGRLG